MVVSVDGKPIANSEELRTAIEQIDADTEVLLTVTRGQETQAIAVQLTTSMDLLAAVP
jgi:S1-C subfamily serine protease